jgi:hypothetical protein
LEEKLLLPFPVRELQQKVFSLSGLKIKKEPKQSFVLALFLIFCSGPKENSFFLEGFGDSSYVHS